MTEREAGTKLAARTADATTRVLERTGERIVAGIERAQKISERLGRYGGRASALPVKELRRVTETSFDSMAEVLAAQKAFALAFLRAVEAGGRRPKPKRVEAGAESARKAG